MKMLHHRSIPVCIILSILTCGIYGMYWFVMLTNEVNEATETPDTSGGMALLLELITCGIYGIYWAWKLGDKLDTSRARFDMPSASFPILFLILNLVGLQIVTLAIAQNELNRYSITAD